MKRISNFLKNRMASTYIKIKLQENWRLSSTILFYLYKISKHHFEECVIRIQALPLIAKLFDIYKFILLCN